MLKTRRFSHFVRSIAIRTRRNEPGYTLHISLTLLNSVQKRNFDETYFAKITAKIRSNKIKIKFKLFNFVLTEYNFKNNLKSFY